MSQYVKIAEKKSERTDPGLDTESQYPENTKNSDFPKSREEKIPDPKILIEKIRKLKS